MSLRHLSARTNPSLPERLLNPSTQVDLQPHLKTEKVTLHRLATFAYEMYEGKRTGHYVCILPIGYEKTTEFLLPFVIERAKRNPTKGLLLAFLRKEQVIGYTNLVNERVGRDVAFPLLGHDPVSCPLAAQGKAHNSKECSPYHAAYAKKAKDYPMLFLTRSMLRKGSEPFHQWAKGERVMVIIDEKPSWQKLGNIHEEDLVTLQHYLTQIPEAKKRTKTVKTVYSVITEAQEALRTLPSRREFQLSTQLRPQHIGILSSKLPLVEDDPKHKALRETLKSLSSLGKTTGRMMSKGKKKSIILAYRKPLPSRPTLILDTTGEREPEYPCGIELIDLAA